MKNIKAYWIYTYNLWRLNVAFK